MTEARCEAETFPDVFALKIGVVSQNFLFRHAAGQHLKHTRNRDAQTPNTGNPIHLIRIHSDTLEVGHLHITHYCNARAASHQRDSAIGACQN